MLKDKDEHVLKSKSQKFIEMKSFLSTIVNKRDETELLNSTIAEFMKV